MKYACKDCEKNYGNLKKDLRKLFKGCHDHCPFYQKDAEKNLEIRKKKAKEQTLTSQIYDHETRIMKKLGVR